MDSYCKRQITFFVRKIEPVHVVQPGLTAGGSHWQVDSQQMADETQVNLEIFKNHCTSKDLTFCFV